MNKHRCIKSLSGSHGVVQRPPSLNQSSHFHRNVAVGAHFAHRLSQCSEIMLYNTPIDSRRAGLSLRSRKQPRKFTPTAASTTERLTTSKADTLPDSADVIVIGSGIGGLSAASILSRNGFNVLVVESHYEAGGCAHTFKRGGYHFESGPSLYSGLTGTGPTASPLAHVLQAIDEPLDLLSYDGWNVILPEGRFATKVGNEDFREILMQIRGVEARDEWDRFLEFMKPLSEAATAIPPAAIRADLGAVLTLARYLPTLLKTGPTAAGLTAPFEQTIKGVVKDPFIKNWLDLLAFLLSGLPTNGTIAAEMAFMLSEFYRKGCFLDFPKGGSKALVDALVRGVTKHDGRVILNAHVDKITVDPSGRADGIILRDSGKVIKAKKAIVSNATNWDTIKLLPKESVPAQWSQDVNTTPANRSFMHLHIGFDATGLDKDLDLHHIIVNSWDKGVDAEQNVVLISIASVIDPSLAPQGKHCLHAYYPATEPFEIWQALDRASPEYQALKEERSQGLWRAVEKIIPDIRSRAEVVEIGTPLTHQRYLRRHKGSYGPGIVAGQGMFPFPPTPVPGLLICGDSTFPGIGLPAVAASGTIAANTVSSVWDHLKMLDDIGL